MKAAYELLDIEYAYNGVVALKIDTYQVASESITAMVGPNGSGKSTLMNILAFINKPAKGTVRFFGSQVENNNQKIYRSRVGFVQQKPYLLNMSVFKNIELGLKLRKVDKFTRLESTRNIIEKFGLGPLESRRAHELSGGEAQKVAIARAMVLQPDVLVLDEPFSHLDKRFKQVLEELLRAIKHEARQTIIFSTHDQLLAQTLADNICSLIDGHLVPASVINLYTGIIDESKGLFVTDKLNIHIPGSIKSGSKLCVESTHLVLSKSVLKSSMRNSFQGMVKSIKDEDGQIHINVVAGEEFHAIITKDALNELAVNAGDSIWVSFKSTALRVY